MIDFKPIAARQAFRDACTAAGTDPDTAESVTLGAPRELLPPAALQVLNGGPKTADYWAWLEAQVVAGEP